MKMHCCGNPFHDFFANLGNFLPVIGAVAATGAAIWRRARRGPHA